MKVLLENQIQSPKSNHDWRENHDGFEKSVHGLSTWHIFNCHYTGKLGKRVVK